MAPLPGRALARLEKIRRDELDAGVEKRAGTVAEGVHALLGRKRGKKSRQAPRYPAEDIGQLPKGGEGRVCVR
jgi:hypothetical protein